MWFFFFLRERGRGRGIEGAGEREREKEKERKRNIDVGEKERLIDCLQYLPDQGSNLQPFGVQGDAPDN